MMNFHRVLCLTATISLWVGVANASADAKDLLIKFTDTDAIRNFALTSQTGGARIERVGAGHWVRVRLTDKHLQTMSVEELRANPNVLAVQPNYKVRIIDNFQIKDPDERARFAHAVKTLRAGKFEQLLAPPDNPEIPNSGSVNSGNDPLFDKQWGMLDIGAKAGWSVARGKGITVAVIDTGVDYTHEDLVSNMWRNPGETGKDLQGRDKTNNGFDDDKNGYIDDIVGWDFISNDNKPFDLAVDPIQVVLGGGNPGHGTHRAGNVAARGDNGKGIGGVAPEAKIMAIRFMGEKGEGSTADAIKAIEYAVRNGAKVLSNSWGSVGEDPSEATQNKALRETIAYAEKKGVLFIAAAGNGHTGVGYDNDTDSKPAYPASYDHDNIISVAALDSNDKLGGFSNWGRKSVDIGAPGVAVFSTTVGGDYSDTVIDLFGMKVTWDGTSMAAPHVAGAAALYWSKHPNASWKDVKNALLKSAEPIAALKGKVVSDGKLNVERLMK